MRSILSQNDIPDKIAELYQELKMAQLTIAAIQDDIHNVQRMCERPVSETVSHCGEIGKKCLICRKIF